MARNAAMHQKDEAGSNRILLVCAPFFSYHTAIRNELERQGWSVTWWSDRASESFVYKLGMRVFPRLVGTLSEPHYLGHLAEASTFHRVLVVKGEALSPEVVNAIRRASPGARMHLYLWDAVENVQNAERTAPLFDAVATFDPQDADRFGWAYKPLFATPAAALVQPDREWAYDWAFVGTLHSDRHRVLHRLRKFNPTLRSYVRAFVPGRPLLLARRLTDWSLLFAPRGTVTTRPMPFLEVKDVLARSRAVVDIEHPRQRGLTMRSIETLLGSKKLITTNRHIERVDLYHPSRVCIVDREHPVVPPEFLVSTFEPIPEAIQTQYRLGNWLCELLRNGPGTRAESRRAASSAS